MILKTKDMEIPYIIMTEENKNGFGYIPEYDQLIAEAPNSEMAAKWEQYMKLYQKSEKKIQNMKHSLSTAFT